MANLITITVEDADDLLNAGMYGAGAVVRLQWAATATGSFADVSGTGSTPTLALVTMTDSYTGYDPVGTSTTWYRTRYENAGATRLSDWTAPFQPGDSSSGTYASLTTFRAFIRNQATPAADVDSDIELLALEAAARAIDRECGRTFRLATTATARRFNVGHLGRGWFPRYGIEIDDVMDITGMTVGFDTSGNGSFSTTSTAFRVAPFNAPSLGMPYHTLLLDVGVTPTIYGYNAEGVEVTAKWGWTATPPAVVNANLIQASRFLKRRDSPFGIAGSPEMGNELRLLSKLDPDVAVMLAHYKLFWGAA
jgi:hypothetical protein